VPVSSCWPPGLRGAIWLVTQRSGHVSRHALVGCLGRDSGFRHVRFYGCGLERPAWLTGRRSRPIQPRVTLRSGGPEFPAA